MRTDTLFYQIFQTFPQLVFALLGRPVVAGYQFTSEEIKEKAFRFDGIFAPPPDQLHQPIFFLEVQFQYNPNFYWEFLSEILLYLNQKKPVQDWIAVAIFPNKAMDVKNLSQFQQEMVDRGRLQRIYLDALPDDGSGEMGLLRLITCPAGEAQQVVEGMRHLLGEKVILEFVKTILVYKFPRLSREEIEKMFTLDDFRQTRVVQDVIQESRQSEAVSLIQRLIRRKFGNLPSDRSMQINTLSVEKLEELAELLLDFTAVDELYTWLNSANS